VAISVSCPIIHLVILKKTYENISPDGEISSRVSNPKPPKYEEDNVSTSLRRAVYPRGTMFESQLGNRLSGMMYFVFPFSSLSVRSPG
jgi:hypothetical protein